MAAQSDSGRESVETLLELQKQWHAALAERLEAYVAGASPGEETAAVRTAYSEAVRDHMAARLVLDQYAGHPALALPRRWEHIMIAEAAGLRAEFNRSRDAAAAGAMLVADLHPDADEHHTGQRRRDHLDPGEAP